MPLRYFRTHLLEPEQSRLTLAPWMGNAHAALAPNQKQNNTRASAVGARRVLMGPAELCIL
jgi:hypothetical protein